MTFPVYMTPISRIKYIRTGLRPMGREPVLVEHGQGPVLVEHGHGPVLVLI